MPFFYKVGITYGADLAAELGITFDNDYCSIKKKSRYKQKQNSLVISPEAHKQMNSSSSDKPLYKYKLITDTTESDVNNLFSSSLYPPPSYTATNNVNNKP